MNSRAILTFRGLSGSLIDSSVELEGQLMVGLRRNSGSEDPQRRVVPPDGITGSSKRSVRWIEHQHLVGCRHFQPLKVLSTPPWRSWWAPKPVLRHLDRPSGVGHDGSVQCAPKPDLLEQASPRIPRLRNNGVVTHEVFDGVVGERDRCRSDCDQDETGVPSHDASSLAPWRRSTETPPPGTPINDRIPRTWRQGNLRATPLSRGGTGELGRRPL